MFSKLVGLLQKEKSNHPLGSEANLDLLMSEIPVSDPSRVLIDVGNYLEDVSRYDSELSPAAMRRAVITLDEFSRPAVTTLLLAFLLPGTREYHSELLWSHLVRHSKLIFLANLHCLEVATRSNEDLSKAKMQLALMATRAMQAWVEQKKLQHFRYKPPDAEWWEAAHKLVGIASKHGVTGLVQQVYDEELPTRSVLHAYLVGLYLEIAPVSNLVAIQVEVLHIWLQQNVVALEFAETPHLATTHVMSLSANTGPSRYSADAPRTQNARYCSTRKLRAAVVQFAHMIRKPEPPEWLIPFLVRRSDLDGLSQILLAHWGEQPPERNSPREQVQESMKVVHGFSLVRRMIACSAFAKLGKSLNYRGADLESLFQELRFGAKAKDGSDLDGQPVDPLDTLQRLETSGDKQMMDQWLKVDASSTGLGAVVQGLRSRNRIGELIGFRFEGDIDWRVGIIRRIGRDAQKRASIGIESLAVPSLCAQVRPYSNELTAWNQCSESGAGWVDAILCADDGEVLLLPPGLFVSNLKVKLNANGKLRDILLSEKIDNGGDWERIVFRPAEE